MLKIEKGIPIPTTTARKGNNVEQLKAMEPGDSVYFDAPIKKKATRFYRVAKRLGIKVVIRVEGDGMRMWRAADTPEATTAIVAARESAALDVFAKRDKAAKQKARKRALGEGKSNRPVSAKVAELDKRAAKASRDKRYRAEQKAKKAAARLEEVQTGVPNVAA